MSGIQQSFAWWSFANRGLSAEDLARTAAEIGYTGVDLVGQEYWPMVKDQGLSIAAIGGHASIEDGLNQRENRDRITREIEVNLKLAQEWDIPNLIVFAGSREAVDDETGAEIAAENLRVLAPLAESAGVNLALETLNSKVDHPGYQGDTTAWCVRVCNLVDSPRVNILYDVYHMQIMEGDVIRTIQSQHNHFPHYHTAGNPGRHDLDDAQEINYPPIFRAIAATGYTGFIAHEFIPKGDTTAALKAAFELTRDSLSS
jgi:hydroxypyruvate isomerase